MEVSLGPPPPVNERLEEPTRAGEDVSMKKGRLDSAIDLSAGGKEAVRREHGEKKAVRRENDVEKGR